MTETIALGDRVVWRSGSHNFTAEKVGTVVFLGPSGWYPEKAPTRLKYWLDKSWKDAVRARRPAHFEDLCRKFPEPDGRGNARAWREHQRMTSRGRYKFERCTSGVIVAVHEYRQLTFDTKKLNVKKPKRPLLYAPRIEARTGHSGLVMWPTGTRRPRFPTEPIGIWNFTVHYQYKGEHLMQKGDQILFPGRGTNQAAAKRECIKRIAEEARCSPFSLKIRVKGIPVDAKAKGIDGAP